MKALLLFSALVFTSLAFTACQKEDSPSYEEQMAEKNAKVLQYYMDTYHTNQAILHYYSNQDDFTTSPLTIENMDNGYVYLEGQVDYQDTRKTEFVVPLYQINVIHYVQGEGVIYIYVNN